MTKLETLAKEIMKEALADGEPVTEEEALEMAQMELGEKANRRYEKSDKPRKKAVKERKVDETKGRFLQAFKAYLEGAGAEVETPTNETDLHFTYCGDRFSVKLTRHRPAKK